MTGGPASCVRWMWKTKDTFFFSAHAALQQEWNLLFKEVQDHNCTTNFMAMDPDQKTLHLLAPKANPFVYCNLILKMYKKRQSLLLCS